MGSIDSLFPTVSSSEKETRSLGKHFARHLTNGDVVALIGDLGAGKTQFVKGVAEEFGIESHLVSSPTFTIAHEYRGRTNLYHMDLYRLTSPAQLLSAGVEEYLNAAGICLIEWPERAEHLLPSRTHIVKLTHQPDQKRLIEYFQALE